MRPEYGNDVITIESHAAFGLAQFGDHLGARPGIFRIMSLAVHVTCVGLRASPARQLGERGQTFR